MDVLTALNSLPPEPAAVQLTKHHGLGNDFLIAIEPPRALTSADAVAWCDRRRGLGADGLLQLVPAQPASGAPSEAQWVQTLWNADGSRAEISGNGIRCVGQALVRHLGLRGDQTLMIQTDAGLRRLDVAETSDPLTHHVRVDMGEPKPGPAPFDGFEALGVEAFGQATVDLGNPHLVALVAEPEGVDLATVGPAVEAHYPDGLNVHFIKIEDAATVILQVWERGAGITEACGSGACAAAYAANHWGLAGERIQVVMPGGSVEVEIDPAGPLLLTGPATFVADVEIGA